MLDPVMMFRDGGPFMYLLLLGLPMGLIVTLVGFALSLFKVRVPLLVWGGPAALFASLGLLGTAQGMGLALEAIGYASAEVRPIMAAAGHSVALYTTLVGWLGASLLCVAATWGSALGHLRADEDDGWDFGTAAALALGGIVLGAIVLGLGLSQQGGVATLLIGVVTMAAGVGLAPMALRASEEPASRARLAEGRLVTASLALGAPLCMGAAASVTGRAMAMEAVAHGSAETRGLMIASGEEIAAAAFTTGLAGAAIIGLLGLVLALPKARYVPGVRMVIHVLGGGLMLVPLLGMGGWTSMRSGSLTEVIEAAFALPPSDDLMVPVVETGRAPAHKRVDVAVSRRDLVVGGTWVFDLDQKVDLMTGVETLALPEDFTADGEGKIRGALAGAELGGVAVMQVDRRVPVAVLAPIVDAAKGAGAAKVEIVVYTSEGEGVVDLPSMPVEDRPLTTLGELLGDTR